MTPDRILEALKQLILAGLAFATSLGGAAGGLPAHGQPAKVKATVREVLSVPSLPSDELLTVDEVDETENENETEDEDDQEEEDLEDLEEVDEEELDQPVDVKYFLLRGPITARPDDGVVGIWTIAGRDVEVTETTVVSTRAANSQVGDWAQVQVEAQAPAEEEPPDEEEPPEEEGGEEPDDGDTVAEALVARSLSVMSSNNLGRVVGIIQSIGEEDESGVSTWVVSGVSVTVSGSTHIVGTPEVGRLADVHGSMTVEEPASEDETTPEEEESAPEGNDNEDVTGDDTGDETPVEAATCSFVAKLVVVRGTPNLPKAEKVQKQSAFRIQGVIESIDAETGAWVISGQTVQVSATTSINEKKGTAEVGAQVRVLTEQDEDGNLVALEIEVLKAKAGNKSANGANKVQKQSAFRIQGVIESIDAETGAWVINGQTVQVSTATSINEKKGTAEAGAQVRVLAQRDENGNLVALEIEVLRAKGGGKATNQAKPPKDNPGQGKKK